MLATRADGSFSPRDEWRIKCWIRVYAAVLNTGPYPEAARIEANKAVLELDARFFNDKENKDAG